MQTRRSSILIDKTFQFRFCFYSVSWIIVLSLLYPVVIAQVFNYTIMLTQGHLPEKVLSQLKDTRSEVVRLVILFHAVFVSVVVLTTFFISHRIAGPLYKLKKTFQECRPGRILRMVGFRKKDYFSDLASEYTAMMTSIDDRQKAAISNLEKAAVFSSGEARERIEEALRELKPQ